MAPPTKKPRLTNAHTPIIKPREWIFGKPQPGPNAKTAITQAYALPPCNKALQKEHDDMARKLAIKSLKLTQVVDENSKFRKEIEELKAKLATQPQPAPAAASPHPSRRERQLEQALTKTRIQLQEANHDLRAQNYFDNRARHYAYHAALTKALKTRAMHTGSRYLALRPTLPYRDYPEGDVIYSL